jgi:hypothetical protein
MSSRPGGGVTSVSQCVLTSMTRIAALGEAPFRLDALPREGWATGDYVAGEVLGRAVGGRVELRTGRTIEVAEGDLVVGALGSRFATLEATGSWEDMGADGEFHLLTGGGLLGKLRSLSTLTPEPVRMRYAGHVVTDGKKETMGRHVVKPLEQRPFRTPVVLLIGTSMSAGKTTAARVIIRRLKGTGRSVLGAKLAGAGRYADILGMKDAGADAVLDFVDAGLPSTHCPRERYEEALDVLLARMAEVQAEVAVVEIGASPLEPYNGEVAVARLREQVVFTVLCASDPYAVVGAMTAYDMRPDLVTGTTSNTEAGVQLVERLTGLRALDLQRKRTRPELERLLLRSLESPGEAG